MRIRTSAAARATDLLYQCRLKRHSNRTPPPPALNVASNDHKEGGFVLEFNVFPRVRSFPALFVVIT